MAIYDNGLNPALPGYQGSAAPAAPAAAPAAPSANLFNNGLNPNFAAPAATKPAPSVVTSQQARKQTTKNMTALSAYEAALSPEQSANNLSQVYKGRSDLQGLYNPDGTARNPNDPRVAGIPTLADWGAKYGAGEESLLKGFTSSPAVNAMLAQIQQGLSRGGQAGVAVDPATRQAISDINGLTAAELEATAKARQAAESEDYRSLDLYMKEISENRKSRDDLTAQLLKSVQKSEEELSLSRQLGDLDSEARGVKQSYREAFDRSEGRNIPLEFIRGQQETALRAANLQLERIATEQGPIVNRLQMASETRQNAVEALKVGIQALDQDTDMAFRLAGFAQEMAKTEKAERDAAKEFALEHRINTPFYLLGGTAYRSSDGKPYSSEESFYTDAGVTSFQEAYERGVISDLSPGSEDERALVMDMISRYPDAGIAMTDTLASASSKLKGSRIYGEQVRGPVGSGGGSGPGTLAGTSIIDKATDARVKAIIASRPGDGGYGAAYEAVKAELGAGVAGAYDKVYQAVFNSGESVDAAFNTAKVASSVEPPKKLSGDAAKVAAIAQTMVPEIEQLKTAFRDDYQGSVQGILLGTNRELSRLVDQVADKVGRIRSGGAVNKDEERRFKDQIANWKDLPFGDSTSAIAALDGLITEANTVTSGLGAGSVPNTTTAPDGSVWQMNQDGTYTQIK